MLKASWLECVQLTKDWGSPLMIFHEDKFKASINRHISAMSSCSPYEIAVPYKACDLMASCAIASAQNLSAEVSSPEHLELALRLRVPGKKIIYNAPYKPIATLRKAISAGVRIHIESNEELKAIAEISKEGDSVARIGIRLSTEEIEPFWSRFGIHPDSSDYADAIQFIADNRDHLNLVAMSAHLGTNIQKPEIYGQLAHMLNRTAKSVEATIGYCLDYIDIGGGYPEKSTLHILKEPKITLFEECISHARAAIDSKYRLVIEPGRSLVGDSLSLLTTIRKKKRTAFRQILTLDGGTNIVPAIQNTEYTLKCISRFKPKAAVESELFGPLCTQFDVLSVGLDLEEMNVGDFILISDIGAYSISMYSQFIFGRPNIIVNKNGAWTLLRGKDELLSKWEKDLWEGIQL